MHISPQLVNPEIMSISNFTLLHMLSIFPFSETQHQPLRSQFPNFSSKNYSNCFSICEVFIDYIQPSLTRTSVLCQHLHYCSQSMYREDLFMHCLQYSPHTSLKVEKSPFMFFGDNKSVWQWCINSCLNDKMNVWRNMLQFVCLKS